MSEPIIVTTLVENSVSGRGLMAEHGLAFHLQAGQHSLLFDTGQTGLVAENARKLGVALEEVEAIGLSHGHNDHTGGLNAVRASAPRARLFIHPAGVAPKFAANPDGTGRSICMDEAAAAGIRSAGQGVVWTSKPSEVLDGIFVTGEIPRQSSFEDTCGRFFLDAACTRPDSLVDDQALYFDTLEGTVVVLGCAHSGVVNTLEYVRELTHGRPILAVLGGMHLLMAGPERIERTIEAFRRWDIQRLWPAHCTGLSAVARLWAAFPERCAAAPVGTRLTFQR